MNGKHLFLTSAGLTDKMKEKFFDIIGKCPKDVKVLYIPTAGIETDGARESLAICFHELFLMGIQYENILVYNLELILSKDYQRTYSSYVTTPFMLTRLLTFEELNQFDAVFVSGGDVSVLCREMSRTGFDRILNNAIKNGLIYVGISAGSMYAAGNLTDGKRGIDEERNKSGKYIQSLYSRFVPFLQAVYTSNRVYGSFCRAYQFIACICFESVIERFGQFAPHRGILFPAGILCRGSRIVRKAFGGISFG